MNGWSASAVADLYHEISRLKQEVERLRSVLEDQEQELTLLHRQMGWQA